MTLQISMSELIADSGVQFGTSGARGLADAMTDRVCWAYTRAFIQVLAGGAKAILLGQDLRPSSNRISSACAAAIEQAGIEVRFAGVLPTPALASYALAHGLSAIMVTGSHIPFDRNGIKFYRSTGEISKVDEAAIVAAEISDSAAYSAALPGIDASVTRHYLNRYLEFFRPGLLAGLRIGIYEHSSVARDLLRELLEALGAQVIGLGRSDGFVPIDTEAVSEEDQLLARQWVAEHNLDALLSTDGDADRPLIGDEYGNWFRGDIVGLLCSAYLSADAVVTPVSCNTAIEHSGKFRAVIRTRIGSPYVIEGMEQAIAAGYQTVVGFEANGGFLLGSSITKHGKTLAALPTRDAFLPMLALLAMAREAGVPLSGLVSCLPNRHTASDRIKDFATEQSRALLAKLSSDDEFRGGLLAPIWGGLDNPCTQQDLTDGLRMTFLNGEIIHLRPSGNAPELRCYAEADEGVRAKYLVNRTLAQVQSSHS